MPAGEEGESTSVSAWALASFWLHPSAEGTRLWLCFLPRVGSPPIPSLYSTFPSSWKCFWLTSGALFLINIIFLEQSIFVIREFLQFENSQKKVREVLVSLPISFFSQVKIGSEIWVISSLIPPKNLQFLKSNRASSRFYLGTFVYL